MSDLATILGARIMAEGPISLADYMAECLLHPRHGYYATRDPLGAAGDFTTAPEISQIFGEMLALCLAQCWQDQGAPDPFILAEAGPGRGTLMADVLRTINAVPGMRAAARLHLVEASVALRAVQTRTLAGAGATWHDRIDSLPDGPLYFVANEFFDALPIRQFTRHRDGWAETRVGLVADRLAPGLGPPLAVAALTDRLADTAPGEIVEICPALPALAGAIGSRIARFGGVALIVDYGGWHSRGDTFQAVAGHRPADPFASPGAADLTAHVDFEALARALAAAGARATAMTAQGVFLERLGITARARALAARLTGAALEAHVAAHRRLTHPAEMGRVFQAIACTPQGAPRPPGLDQA